jgi:hypothetical protein
MLQVSMLKFHTEFSNESSKFATGIKMKLLIDKVSEIEVKKIMTCCLLLWHFVFDDIGIVYKTIHSRYFLLYIVPCVWKFVQILLWVGL